MSKRYVNNTGAGIMLKRASKLLCVAIILTLLLSGCQQDVIKCLVIMPSSLDVKYPAIEAAAQKWADSRKVSLTMAAPSLPTAYEQQQVLEQYLDEEWDIICIEPLGKTELAPLLEYVHDKGTIVVSIKSDISCADYNIKPFSNEETGKQMMGSLSELMGGHGMYLTMVPATKAADALEIESAAFEEQRTKYVDMFAASRLEQSEGQADKAKQLVDKAYADFQINGVLFFSTQEGIGVSDWQQEQNGKLSAVGLGDKDLLADELKNGTIDILYYWNEENLILASLEVGFKAAESKNFQPGDVITLPFEGYETLRRTEGNTWQGRDIQTVTAN
jgi:ABC-type sugar transport system substrate-binding protein